MLEVDLVEGESERLQTALRHGRCELALMYDLGLDDDIERELLAVAPPYVILPPAHRLARNAKGIHLRDIADDPMVLLDLPHSRDYFRSLVASVGVEPHIRYRTSSYETVRALVARGHGFAILNQEPAEPTTYDGGSVVKVPLVDKLDPHGLSRRVSRHGTPNAGKGGCRRRSRRSGSLRLQPVDIRSAVSEQDAGFLTRGMESLRELDLGD